MRIIMLNVASLLCSGCALTTATINVPYQSIATAGPVPGASGVTVTVTTEDQRSANRDRVSVKKNGYGMEMAPIVDSSDVPTSVGNAFSQELTARGFKLGANGVGLKISLVEFYNDFKTGFFSGDADADVSFNTEITAASGKIVFTRFYEGTGTEPNIQIMGGDNAQAALTKAFQSAVASAFNDPDFTKALVAAGAATAGQ